MLPLSRIRHRDEAVLVVPSVARRFLRRVGQSDRLSVAVAPVVVAQRGGAQDFLVAVPLGPRNQLVVGVVEIRRGRFHHTSHADDLRTSVEGTVVFIRGGPHRFSGSSDRLEVQLPAGLVTHLREPRPRSTIGAARPGFALAQDIARGIVGPCEGGDDGCGGRLQGAVGQQAPGVVGILLPLTVGEVEGAAGPVVVPGRGAGVVVGEARRGLRREKQSGQEQWKSLDQGGGSGLGKKGEKGENCKPPPASGSVRRIVRQACV